MQQQPSHYQFNVSLLQCTIWGWMRGVSINNWTLMFLELGCFHRVQYKFIPAEQHLLLIPEKSVVDGCRAWGFIEDEGTGALGMHGWVDSDRQTDSRTLTRAAAGERWEGCAQWSCLVILRGYNRRTLGSAGKAPYKSITLQWHSITLLQGFTDS